MKTDNVCSSSGVRVTNDVGAVKFKCPKCGGPQIIRSSHSRSIVAKYKCHECSFEGPN